MTAEAMRWTAALAAAPAHLVVQGLQKLALGQKAVLEMTIRPTADTFSRQYALERLRRASHEPALVGVLLRLEGPPGSWAACQDFRAAIRRLRHAGKGVYAWLEHPGNAQMWLAAGCDRVFMLPTGELALVGVGAELTFFGSALERLGLVPDFESAGAYKSFGEAYTRTFASPANQEAVGTLCRDLHAQLVAGICEGRGLSSQTLDEALRRAPLAAAEAVAAGLVDQLAYPDEVQAWLREQHGDDLRVVRFENWAMRDGVSAWLEQWSRPGPQVVVLHLDGPIVVDDKGPAQLVRARRVTELLRSLAKDDRTRAVVLHVNSPGGSAMASDLIWREVERVQRKKPVVACFEDVAASGGYYLSAPAAEILARPATLTGSIGVFGGKLVAREAFRKLGVHTQEIKAAPNANLYSATKPFTPDQRVRFRASLQRFYDGFVQRVAAGRRRPPEAVEPYCRGRVWTGRKARGCGLVDRHGDLYEAVDRARFLGGLHPGAYRRVDQSAQPPRSFFSKVVQEALRSVLPAAQAQTSAHNLLRLAESVLGPLPAPELELVLTHTEQPLTLLPFQLRVS